MKAFRITVPASSANIGPGFDSAGIALNRYLTLHVEKSNQWEIHHLSPLLPLTVDHKDHLIYRTVKYMAERYGKSLPNGKINVKSNIPLASGLGSSATAIIAGVELASQLCELKLTSEQKLKYAVELEGHPDNIAPALLGGMVFCAVTSNGDIAYTRIKANDLDFVAFIPNFELETKKSRQLIPEKLSIEYASRASAISNVMVGALLSGNYQLAGKMMSEDLFHEPYRKASIPNYSLIKQETEQSGAYGTFISGSGPTMMAVVPKGNGERVKNHMHMFLQDYEIACLEMDTKGLRIELE